MRFQALWSRLCTTLFFALFLLPQSVHGADVSLYSIVKSQGWKQTGPSVLSRSDGDKFVFQAGVIEAAPGRVGTAVVQLPVTSLERRLMRGTSDVYDLSYANSSPPEGGQEFTTVAEFDASYPNGSYSLRISTQNDGTRVISANLTGDAYPSVPQISNYAEAQQINPANDSTLSWFPFVGGTTSDFIHLRVVDNDSTVYASGLPGSETALNGTSTAATVPKRTLLPGKSYRIILFFAKAASIDTTSYPGATGCIGYGHTLYTTIQTMPSLPSISMNRAVSLDGSSYISIASDPSLQNAAALSIEAWCFPTTNTGSKFGTVLNKGDGSSGTSARSYELRWFPDNTMSFNLYLETVEGSPDFISLTTAVVSNRWTHVATTFDSETGIAAVYTNGMLAAKAEGLIGRQVRQTSHPLVLGWTPTFQDTYASGFFDEFRVWAIARSEEEILADMACTLSGTEPHLKGYWNFDSGAYEDRSRQRMNGTSIGNVAVVPQSPEEHILAGCDRTMLSLFNRIGDIAEWVVKGRIGASYQVEASTNLMNWNELIPLPTGEGSLRFQPTNTASDRSFFRALRQ